MSHYLTPATNRAIKAYGREACLTAFRMSQEGEGASTIALTGPRSIKTTRQADAAINAGRDIVNNDKSWAESI